MTMQVFKILLKSFKTFVLIKIYEDNMFWCFTISTSQKSEFNKFKLKFLVIMESAKWRAQRALVPYVPTRRTCATRPSA